MFNKTDWLLKRKGKQKTSRGWHRNKNLNGLFRKNISSRSSFSDFITL